MYTCFIFLLCIYLIKMSGVGDKKQYTHDRNLIEKGKLWTQTLLTVDNKVIAAYTKYKNEKDQCW